MHRNQGPVYYGSYLKLDELLAAQKPLSFKYGNECHDETLFIIVHQVYELWFKQILHELKSINGIFSNSTVNDEELSTVISRTTRITKIQQLLLDQLSVMETMTPMDFLEFRDLLIPASGFQSVQFREIEVCMGLNTRSRAQVDRDYFLGRLDDKDKQRVLKMEEEPSLLANLEKWLERMPFTFGQEFNFWEAYAASVKEMLDSDEAIIAKNQATLSATDLEASLSNLKSTRDTFESLTNQEQHQKLIASGKRKLSQKATLNALFILLYRHKPLLHTPYLFLNSLMDIDENFTTWRYRHAIMAHRMLGTKIGTGGSSGHQYLKMAAENNRVYLDLFNLSTYLIPRSKLPELPQSLLKALDFYFNSGENLDSEQKGK